MKLAPARWALLAAISALAPPAAAASFPCDKASSAVEKLICSSPQVSELDEYLSRYYAAARVALRHAESCVADDQRTWLRVVRGSCKDSTCLRRVYLERLAVLHALQPGATSLRSIELPALAPLVWIVPPAADQVAAPRGRRTNALMARGKIVDDTASGDGYVVQSSVGKKHLLVPLMFLEQPTIDALTGLARLPSASYEVRGRTDAVPGEPGAFSSSECTFIYRIEP